MKSQLIKKNAANIVSAARIVGSVALIFTETLSPLFFAVYTLTGLTDFIDGPIARRTHTESLLGKRLDSIGDLVFYIVMMLKMLPYLRMYLSRYIWAAINATVVLRLGMYGYVGIKHHMLMSNHTKLNKTTGFSLFFLPYVINTELFIVYASIVTAIAVAAALHEASMIYKYSRNK